MAEKKYKGNLGNVVVVGGNGFLGHHIVNQLLTSWTVSAVSSVDLRCARNRNPDAAYYECDITDNDRLTEVLKDLKPDAVIHTASPQANHFALDKEVFRKVNVDGTRSVVEACQKAGVKALVYTSSASIISDFSTALHNADERWPVLRGDQQPEYYSETKAAAEEIVLKANRQEPYNLLTAAIRPAAIFGEGDLQLFEGFIHVLNSGRDKIQIGDNTNLFDFTYVGNVAHAHLLAARLLLATAANKTVPLSHERVDGEPFFVTNDSPCYFWDFARAVYRAAGSERGLSGIWVLPAEIGIFFGMLSEIFGSILGKRPAFSKMRATLSTTPRYYNIAKAKSVLGYEPICTLQAGIEKGLKWYMDNKAEVAAIQEKKD